MKHTTTEKERAKQREYHRKYYKEHREEINQKRKERGWDNYKKFDPLAIGDDAKDRIKMIIELLTWRTAQVEDTEFMIRTAMKARRELGLLLDGQPSEDEIRQIRPFNLPR